jgi:RHS repeat-associated protein
VDQRAAAATAGSGEPAGAPGAGFAVAAPRVELPKGGGALRGMGEKFAANPATGTGSLSLPLATSPGRTGFGPQLALAYDSGAGNGPFGFGWSLSLPSVTRRTDQGLPRYDDAAESDVFLLSGAEDLVPVLDVDGTRAEDRASAPGHVVHRYRPRVEGLFARIERWTRTSDGDVHWRSISADNVLTLYGKDARSRIADPADARRVAGWLVCETRDDRGNAVLYDYKAEDGAGADLAAAHERNRGGRNDPGRTANRYLKRIRYGNRTPLLDAGGRRPAFLDAEQVDSAGWMFEVVLDYGEHDLAVPRPAETGPWGYRPDPASSYRFGFEVRTARRCRRVLMFHHFAAEPGVGADCLVRSTDLGYADEVEPPDPRAPIHSFVRSATRCGYRREGPGYVRRSLPPVEFDYSVPVVQGTVQDVEPASLENLPSGLDGAAYRWVDLHGEGVPGLLTEQGGAWYYKRNLSPVSDRAVELAAIERVDRAPILALAGGPGQLLDLLGDGLPDVVAFDGAVPGYHRHDGAEGWEPFRPFPARLSRDTRDPAVRFVDLDGDGRADVLISEDDALVWHPSLGEDGFGPALRVPAALDEETGPRLVFADPEQSVHLADMTGDGLVDLARVRNGEVCYWPNLGHGRFGAKVTMDGAPHLDRPDSFDQRRVRLADVDGSGGVDLVYLGGDGVTLHFNQSGNGWSAGQRVAAFPAVDDVAAIQVVDLLGNGTACLVWSSPLPGHATRPLRFVDLMGGQKPHLLTRMVNNLGAETTVHYAPSTRFARADERAGRPWVTKLPFPVHVVDRVETLDRIADSRFVTRYAYHHGYFDGPEREFRGFGLVEQWDTEDISALGPLVDASSHAPPVLTRTWFHTGAPAGVAGSLEDHYRGEYYPAAEAGGLLLADTVLPAGLGLDEQREAGRALKGAMLHQEVYALDGGDREAHPYVVTEQNRTVRMLQPRAGNRHAVFLTHPREALTVHYERDPADPRVAHALTLAVDDFGNVLASATVGYGRLRPDPALAPADQDRQAERHVTCAENTVTDPVDSTDAYRNPLPSESRSCELGGLAAGGAPLPFEVVRDAIAAAEPIPYEQAVTGDRLQKRLVEHLRTRYRPDDLGAAADDPLALLPPGRLESRALPGESYRLALTPGLVAERFGDKVDDGMLATDGGYVHVEDDAGWWQRSGRVFLSPGTDDDPAAELTHARRHFFLPVRFRDPFHRAGFETESVLTHDVHDLAVRETRDALDNVATAEHDYRVLQPRLLTDPNGNRAEAAFDALGLVVGTAVMGKTSESRGDSLAGLDADLDETAALAQLADPLADPHAVLGRASTRLIYDLFAYMRSRHAAEPQPAVVATLARETHDADLGDGERTRVQHAFSYSDGFGREIQRKIQAEPDPLGPRWVGSGWTVLDDKGRPVRRYEPFFSATHRFELARTEGVSSILLYDPVGRPTATLHPTHTWDKLVVGAWRQEAWDVNDTVLLDPRDDPTVAAHVGRLSPADYLPSWHAARADGAVGPHEQAAAVAAAEHAATPGVTHLDSLGRAFLAVAHNRSGDPPEDTFASTRTVMDIEGNQREVVDALDRAVMSYDYDLLGIRIHSTSTDAGERWSLPDATGRSLYTWDSRGHRLRTGYDVLSRPVGAHLQVGAGPEQLVGRTGYGESVPAPESRNLRGRAHQAFDGAGVHTTAEYDFKGNAVATSRRFARDYKATPDWSTDVPLEPEEHASRLAVDALDRPVRQTTPDGSITSRTYSEAGLLETVEASVRGGTPAERFVTAVDHDAKGRRTRIERGNATVTTYDYDPLTFRLLRLRTSRGAESLQDLSYTYDPVGNITHVEDAAQQTVFFRNARVEPSNDYRYDALYQLVHATGREHPGQLGTGPSPAGPVPGEHPGDGAALARYAEHYGYDPVGNIVEMRHLGSDPAHPGWTRAYRYGGPGNRLGATQVGTGDVEPYGYDAHGNMTSMPHLRLLRWDHRDQLQASAGQVVTDGTAQTTYFVYDGGGERVRKVTESAAAPGRTPMRMKERAYLGDVELYREYDGLGAVVVLERETLHVLDDLDRIALVETRTIGDDGSAAQLVRHQLANHVGSASLELDSAGAVVTYEEYFPYGSTSYEAVDARLGAAPKRYRYTGQERDEETGLACHGARYYAPWLGRWTACDPAELVDGPNLYRYAGNQPISKLDPSGMNDCSGYLECGGSLADVSGTAPALPEAVGPSASADDSDPLTRAAHRLLEQYPVPMDKFPGTATPQEADAIEAWSQRWNEFRIAAENGGQSPVQAIASNLWSLLIPDALAGQFKDAQWPGVSWSSALVRSASYQLRGIQGYEAKSEVSVASISQAEELLYHHVLQNGVRRTGQGPAGPVVYDRTIPARDTTFTSITEARFLNESMGVTTFHWDIFVDAATGSLAGHGNSTHSQRPHLQWELPGRTNAPSRVYITQLTMENAPRMPADHLGPTRTSEAWGEYFQRLPHSPYSYGTQSQEVHRLLRNDIPVAPVLPSRAPVRPPPRGR